MRKFSDTEIILLAIGTGAIICKTRRKQNVTDEWEESEHPRDKNGKFATSNSGGNSKANKNNSSDNTIAGVKKGKPMSFKQANEGRVNPNYSKGGGYQTNCQACIAVFEARMRGYNIEALPSSPKSHEELGYKPYMAYKDAKTGESPRFIKSNVKDGKECRKWLNEQIKPGERFAFAYSPEMTIRETGHLIEVIKTEDNKLIFYDPQKGETYNESFLDDIGYETPFGNLTICYSPMIFRIDDKELNLEILNNISTMSKDIIGK